MEHRRLIKFGNSSHIISLPKSWIDENKLKKGDSVHLKKNSNSELIIFPSEKEEKPELKEVTINIDNKNEEQIRREIFSNYIGGCDIFIINGRNLKDCIKQIRNDLHGLMSISIIEQTSNRIVAKDFFNIKEISIENLFRRMDTLTRVMIEDSKSTIKNEKIYEEVYERDIEINSIHYLISRIIRKALIDVNLLNSLNLTPTYLFNISLLNSSIEKIADETKRISRYLRQVKKNIKNSQKLKELINIYSVIEKEFENVMKAYYTNNKALAYELSDNRVKIINDCNKLLKGADDPAIGQIIEKLKGMETYVRNIARVVREQ